MPRSDGLRKDFGKPNGSWPGPLQCGGLGDGDRKSLSCFLSWHNRHSRRCAAPRVDDARRRRASWDEQVRARVCFPTRLLCVGSVELLAATCPCSVCTSDPVDFAPGEVIVVSSSDRNFTHSEVAGIISVFNTSCFEVNITFQWFHKGTRFSGASLSWDAAVDNRAEVGLLSRSERFPLHV